MVASLFAQEIGGKKAANGGTDETGCGRNHDDTESDLAVVRIPPLAPEEVDSGGRNRSRGEPEDREQRNHAVR